MLVGWLVGLYRKEEEECVVVVVVIVVVVVVDDVVSVSNSDLVPEGRWKSI